MVGILVCGNTHFILAGPKPSDLEARALARHWTIFQIGEAKSPRFEKWEIRNKEFRENLTWAVIVPDASVPAKGVTALLDELQRRGIEVDRCGQKDHVAD